MRPHILLAVAVLLPVGLVPSPGAPNGLGEQGHARGLELPSVNAALKTLQFAGSNVQPAGAPAKWTSTFTFKTTGGGTLYTYLAEECPKLGGCGPFGFLEESKPLYAASPAHWTLEIIGRYGHGMAEEAYTFHFSLLVPAKEFPPAAGGPWKVVVKLTCPSDPWLTGVACAKAGEEKTWPPGWDAGTHEWVLSMKGPFPLTAGSIPPNQRSVLLHKAYPLQITKPSENQEFSPGSPITVALVKPAPVLNDPVTLTFTQGSGWAGSTIFKKPASGLSTQVPSSAFSTPGNWRVEATYLNSVSGPVRHFKIMAVGGPPGGPPGGQPGTPGGAAGVPEAGARLPRAPCCPARHRVLRRRLARSRRCPRRGSPAARRSRGCG